jgi:P-type E1-E2 ATPase
MVLRDPAALEWLGRPGGMRHVVLDKTGTLTEGRMRVVAWEWIGEVSPEQRTAITATVVAVEAKSAHPIATSIMAYAGEVAAVAVLSWEERVGLGMVAETELGSVRIGNARLTGMSLATEAVEKDAIGHLGVTINGQPVARICCADPLRPGVADLVQRLQHAGATVHVLSGDEPTIVTAVAHQIGVSPAHAHGGLLPEEKAAQVESLKQDGLDCALNINISMQSSKLLYTMNVKMQTNSLKLITDKNSNQF